jgi:hypothetical protein
MVCSTAEDWLHWWSIRPGIWFLLCFYPITFVSSINVVVGFAWTWSCVFINQSYLIVAFVGRIISLRCIIVLIELSSCNKTLIISLRCIIVFMGWYVCRCLAICLHQLLYESTTNKCRVGLEWPLFCLIFESDEACGKPSWESYPRMVNVLSLS